LSRSTVAAGDCPLGYVRAVRHAALRTAGFAAVLATMLIAACGDDDAGPSPGTSTSSSVTSTTAGQATSTSTAVVTTAGSGATTVVPTTPPGTDLGPKTLDDASTISTTGLDAVIFGMTVPQAEDAAGTRLLPDTAIATTVDCAVVRPEGGPDGVSFTVSKGTIERVDIAAPAKIKTRSGAGLATTVAQLQTLYGARLAAADGTTTYVFTPADAADAVYRVVFDTDGTTVTGFRAGRTALVQPATPCG
jgi:hypothetical protein